VGESGLAAGGLAGGGRFCGGGSCAKSEPAGAAGDKKQQARKAGRICFDPSDEIERNIQALLKTASSVQASSQGRRRLGYHQTSGGTTIRSA